MGSEKNKPAEPAIESEAPKVIEWEELEQELARLWSLSSALNKSKDRKADLHRMLEPLIEVREESLRRSNELEEMRQKLESRRMLLGKLLMRSKDAAEVARNREEELNVGIRSLLVSGNALSGAHKKLKEANGLLAGERGHIHLKKLQKTLQDRIKHMVTQVSVLYPVKAIGSTQKEKLEPSFVANKSGNSSGSLAILGLQLNSVPLRKVSFFSDKKEIQRSATALGYVAHAVSLISSYLDVPLRYPLRMGGSRSYISDHASLVASASPDSLSNSTLFTSSNRTEFPLFLEGQDTTRSAYAIFLLNKDLEQLLNFIGIQSLGPRHVLANLKELFKIIQFKEFID
ncbi:hypothetical protein Scep_013798 [Stephania cephalantha]|uniref:UV radiation resistance-associated gene protein n=1 Tax=Stephania cephalantha TaxID=152367 RepID=A0AAP0J234_9MAGN